MRIISLEDIDEIKDIGILIDIASKNLDKDILLKLANHQSMNVRRAVARNIYSPSHVIDILVDDVTENVRFMALRHRNCIATKEESERISKHRCVVCEVQEKETLERCLKCG